MAVGYASRCSPAAPSLILMTASDHQRTGGYALSCTRHDGSGPGSVVVGLGGRRCLFVISVVSWGWYGGVSSVFPLSCDCALQPDAFNMIS
eukprot:3909586-Rhodomonas_salina.2